MLCSQLYMIGYTLPKDLMYLTRLLLTGSGLQGDTVKSGHGSKLATNKNSQFFSKRNETWSILSSHEMVILTKFHGVWRKIVDFLLVANFKACPILTGSPCN